MKWILGLAILLLANPSFTQTCSLSSPVVDRETSPSVKRARFRDAVKEELTHFKNGLRLYSHSDRFHRFIDRKVAIALGVYSTIEQPGDESERILSSDTSIRADLSRSSADQDETTIAISRVDPKVIVAGANDDQMYGSGMPAYVTRDAGATWHTYRLPSVIYRTAVAGGDPIVVADNQGTFYYAFLIYPENGDNTASNLLVARSTDGQHWVYGVPVIAKSRRDSSFEDKESIGVDMDPQSPHYGRLYIVWMKYDTDGTTSQLISWSDDGADSWSTPVQVSSDFGYFSMVRVGKGGTVFVSSSSAYNTGVHGMHVSYDGGQTFTERDIANFTDYPTNLFSYSGLKGDTGIRAFPYVAFDVDRSTNTLYAAYGSWENDAFGALYCISSQDDGVSWKDLGRVAHAAADHDHFLPWLSVDPVVHNAYLSFYSSESDAANVRSQFMRTTLSDPQSFTALGSAPFDPLTVDINGAPFIGDYVGSDAYDGYFAAAWTEGRKSGHDGDVYANISGPLTPLDPNSSVAVINTHRFEIGNFSSNPVMTDAVSFTIDANEACEASIALYDLRGVQVRSWTRSLSAEVNTVKLDLSGLSAGVYECAISNGRSSSTRELVLLH